MALPKRKTSKSRRDQRRSHWKLVAPNVINCPHCSQPKLPHRVCANCGYYGEREVIVPEEG